MLEAIILFGIPAVILIIVGIYFTYKDAHHKRHTSLKHP